MSQKALINALARCFLSEGTLPAIVDSITHLMAHRLTSLNRVARDFLATTDNAKPKPRHKCVAAFISAHPTFRRSWLRHSQKLAPVHLLTSTQRMQPAAAAWNLPRIESAAELADWFWLDYGQLDWFADLHQLNRKTPIAKLRHYHYRTLPKPGGGLRIIEAPKPRLKEMQRQILDEILIRIPAHPSSHGFIRNRSILTFTAPHAGQDIVLRMDLKDFFPTFTLARIQALFRTLGYPETVSNLLGAIFTALSQLVRLSNRLPPVGTRKSCR